MKLPANVRVESLVLVQIQTVYFAGGVAVDLGTTSASEAYDPISCPSG